MPTLSGPDRIPVVDLRSDTVTQPTDAMWEAMRQAPLGDDVMGDDPTVNALEATAAEMLGKEAAVFASSGTQSNLMGIMAHCGRGDEYIVGQQAHTYRMEGGGAAVLGSIQPQPLPNQPDGTLDLAEVEANVKPHDNPHYAMTCLLALENTWNGRIETAVPERSERACSSPRSRLASRRRPLLPRRCWSRRHTARWRPPSTRYRSVFPKVWGCPAGSLLVGSGELVARARRIRKMLGGGLRQAGVIAGAGLHALEHHVDRMADDHRRARTLAEGLAAIDGVNIDLGSVETNMVFVELDANGADDPAPQLVAFAAERGVKLRASYGRTLRLVTHLDVNDDDISMVLGVVRDWSAS